MINLLNIELETLDDVVGQKHLKFLFNNIINTNDDSSFIFYGKPGIGKTSVAALLAKLSNKKSQTFNASIGKKEELINKLENSQILILDEIHRLNKDKQDILLSYLEKRQIIIYATTSENPLFKVNPAIRSRMHILQFKPISEEEILEYLILLIKKYYLKVEINHEIFLKIIRLSNGDLRNTLNNFNLILKFTKNSKWDWDLIQKIIPHINMASDKNGDLHYDYLSAFHKSMRGSDVDAALYYAAIIISSGDFDGLYRRILACSYEDISLANPLISIKATNAIANAERLGMPEALLPLGNIIVEIALSPKSNSTYKAMKEAMTIVNEGQIYEVPSHLKDNHYKSAKKLNHGINYQYPHDFANSYVEQQYLPKELKSKHFFEFGNNKNEQKLKEYWLKIKRNK